MTDANVFQQTPSEIIDYTINWAIRGIGTDTIAASSWSISPSGDLSGTSPPPSYTNTTTTVWLSGGTAGIFYAVTNTITTAGGRQLQDTFTINCVAQRQRPLPILIIVGPGVITQPDDLTGEDGITILVGEDGTTNLTGEN